MAYATVAGLASATGAEAKGGFTAGSWRRTTLIFMGTFWANIGLIKEESLALRNGKY
ncbi:MAG: hypothetical protein ACE5NM_06580 [Sedimentisphaerales bacterium]